MARYAINSMDCAAEGMERLRSQSEFILLAYPSAESTVADLREQWQADIDSCARSDSFDYSAARAAIADYCAERESYLQRELRAVPWDELDGDDMESAVAFRLYVEEESEPRAFLQFGGAALGAPNGPFLTVEVPARATETPRKGRTLTGYGNAIPTQWQVRFNGRWRRVRVAQFSNAGTAYIGAPGKWEAIVDLEGN